MEGDEVRKLVQRTLGLDFVFPFFGGGRKSSSHPSDVASTNAPRSDELAFQNQSRSGTFVRCMVPPVPEKPDLVHRLFNDSTVCVEFVVQVIPKARVAEAILRPEDQSVPVSNSEVQAQRKRMDSQTQDIHTTYTDARNLTAYGRNGDPTVAQTVLRSTSEDNMGVLLQEDRNGSTSARYWPSPSRDAVRFLLGEEDAKTERSKDRDSKDKRSCSDSNSTQHASQAVEQLMQLLQHSHFDPCLLDVTGFEPPTATSRQTMPISKSANLEPAYGVVNDINAHDLQFILTQKISGKNTHSPSARAVLPMEPMIPRHPAFLPLYSAVQSSHAFLLVSPCCPLTLDSAIKHSHRGLLLDDCVYESNAASTSELVRTSTSGRKQVDGRATRVGRGKTSFQSGVFGAPLDVVATYGRGPSLRACGLDTDALLRFIAFQLLQVVEFMHERNISHPHLSPAHLHIGKDLWLRLELPLALHNIPNAGNTATVDVAHTKPDERGIRHIPRTTTAPVRTRTTKTTTVKRTGAIAPGTTNTTTTATPTPESTKLPTAPIETTISKATTTGPEGIRTEETKTATAPIGTIITKTTTTTPTPTKLPEFISLTEQWRNRSLSNLDYIMAINTAAGRNMGDSKLHPIVPWVTDFTSSDLHASALHWRDLTKTKFRLAKGDSQLDTTFRNSATPHHIPESLSDITYVIYMARRTPLRALRTIVRSNFESKEYPASMQRIYEWTPDECIPEFYIDPEVFVSLHQTTEMENLSIPPWCPTFDSFIHWHRAALESEHVSRDLHHWIDLNFGYKLTGQPAVEARNVTLPPQHRNDPDSFVCDNPGFVQLFTMPHPPRIPNTQLSSTSPTSLSDSPGVSMPLSASSSLSSLTSSGSAPTGVQSGGVLEPIIRRPSSADHIQFPSSQTQRGRDDIGVEMASERVRGSSLDNLNSSSAFPYEFSLRQDYFAPSTFSFSSSSSSSSSSASVKSNAEHQQQHQRQQQQQQQQHRSTTPTSKFYSSTSPLGSTVGPTSNGAGFCKDGNNKNNNNNNNNINNSANNNIDNNSTTKNNTSAMLSPTTTKGRIDLRMPTIIGISSPSPPPVQQPQPHLDAHKVRHFESEFGTLLEPKYRFKIPVSLYSAVPVSRTSVIAAAVEPQQQQQQHKNKQQRQQKEEEDDEEEVEQQQQQNKQHQKQKSKQQLQQEQHKQQHKQLKHPGSSHHSPTNDASSNVPTRYTDDYFACGCIIAELYTRQPVFSERLFATYCDSIRESMSHRDYARRSSHTSTLSASSRPADHSALMSVAPQLYKLSPIVLSLVVDLLTLTKPRQMESDWRACQRELQRNGDNLGDHICFNADENENRDKKDGNNNNNINNNNNNNSHNTLRVTAPVGPDQRRAKAFPKVFHTLYTFLKQLHSLDTKHARLEFIQDFAPVLLNRCVPSDMAFVASEILLPPCLELLTAENTTSTGSTGSHSTTSGSKGSDITRACLVIIRAMGPFLGHQVHRIAVHLGRALDRAVSREDWVSVEKLLELGAVQTVLKCAGPMSFEEVCLPCLLDVVDLVGAPVALATRASYALAEMARNECLGPARVVRVVLPPLIRKLRGRFKTSRKMDLGEWRTVLLTEGSTGDPGSGGWKFPTSSQSIVESLLTATKDRVPKLGSRTGVLLPPTSPLCLSLVGVALDCGENVILFRIMKEARACFHFASKELVSVITIAASRPSDIESNNPPVSKSSSKSKPTSNEDTPNKKENNGPSHTTCSRFLESLSLLHCLIGALSPGNIISHSFGSIPLQHAHTTTATSASGNTTIHSKRQTQQQQENESMCLGPLEVLDFLLQCASTPSSRACLHLANPHGTTDGYGSNAASASCSQSWVLPALASIVVLACVRAGTLGVRTVLVPLIRRHLKFANEIIQDNFDNSCGLRDGYLQVVVVLLGPLAVLHTYDALGCLVPGIHIDTWEHVCGLIGVSRSSTITPLISNTMPLTKGVGDSISGEKCGSNDNGVDGSENYKRDGEVEDEDGYFGFRTPKNIEMQEMVVNPGSSGTSMINSKDEKIGRETSNGSILAVPVTASMTSLLAALRQESNLDLSLSGDLNLTTDGNDRVREMDDNDACTDAESGDNLDELSDDGDESEREIVRKRSESGYSVSSLVSDTSNMSPNRFGPLLLLEERGSVLLSPAGENTNTLTTTARQQTETTYKDSITASDDTETPLLEASSMPPYPSRSSVDINVNTSTRDICDGQGQDKSNNPVTQTPRLNFSAAVHIDNTLSQRIQQHNGLHNITLTPDARADFAWLLDHNGSYHTDETRFDRQAHNRIKRNSPLGFRRLVAHSFDVHGSISRFGISPNNNENGVSVMAADPAERLLLTGTNSGAVSLWSIVGPPRLLHTNTSLHNSPVRSVCFTRDNSRALSVDGSAHVWDIETGKRELTLHSGCGRAITAASPLLESLPGGIGSGGFVFAAGAVSGLVSVYDVRCSGLRRGGGVQGTVYSKPVLEFALSSGRRTPSGASSVSSRSGGRTRGDRSYTSPLASSSASNTASSGGGETIQEAFPITSLTCGGARGRDWIAVGQLDGVISILDPRNGGGSGGMGVVARWKAHESPVVCLKDIGAQTCSTPSVGGGEVVGGRDEGSSSPGSLYGSFGGGSASSCLVSMSAESSVRMWNVDNLGPQASRIQCILKVSGLPRLDSAQQPTVNAYPPLYRATAMSANGSSNIGGSMHMHMSGGGGGGGSGGGAAKGPRRPLTPRTVFSASVRDSLAQLPTCDSVYVSRGGSSGGGTGFDSAAGEFTPTLFMAGGSKLSVVPLRLRHRATEVRANPTTLTDASTGRKLRKLEARSVQYLQQRQLVLIGTSSGLVHACI